MRFEREQGRRLSSGTGTGTDQALMVLLKAGCWNSSGLFLLPFPVNQFLGSALLLVSFERHSPLQTERGSSLYFSFFKLL